MVNLESVIAIVLLLEILLSELEMAVEHIIRAITCCVSSRVGTAIGVVCPVGLYRTCCIGVVTIAYIVGAVVDGVGLLIEVAWRHIVLLGLSLVATAVSCCV